MKCSTQIITWMLYHCPLLALRSRHLGCVAEKEGWPNNFCAPLKNANVSVSSQMCFFIGTEIKPHITTATATAAEDQSGCYSCQLRRKGKWGYNLHGLSKIAPLKIVKRCHVQMSFDFCCILSVVDWEFKVSDMKAWIYPALYQQFILLVVVQQCGAHILCKLWPLSISWVLFECHSLAEYCCWSCTFLYDQQDNTSCQKHRSSLTGY